MMDKWEKRNSEEYYRIAGPLLAELAEAGFAVKDLGHLYNARPRIEYRKAVPILLKWLPRIDELRVKDDIVCALAVPWEKRLILPVLVAEFERKPLQPSESGLDFYRWRVADSLSYNADDRVVEDIIRLATDKRYGRSREMLGVALGRMKDPRAVDTLIALLDDPEMAGHAAMGLAKIKPIRARPYLEPFLNHKVRWIRKEAVRAIANIDKASS